MPREVYQVIMTGQNASFSKCLAKMNKFLIPLILFLGIKGTIFHTGSFIDLVIALFLLAVLCSSNGIIGILSKTNKQEIIGEFFVAVVLVMTCAYFVLIYLSNPLVE
ncbi:hypothetical protein [Neobacillus sp. YIM B06451]|uniref:hypothetical protein n=1 Tax=Neobacillus sp. YIM B06451 TaxID=3070994 RepID=UPI00292F45AE|nr:hypothetical protein [Neobacillus sp. YIM B06451]